MKVWLLFQHEDGIGASLLGVFATLQLARERRAEIAEDQLWTDRLDIHLRIVGQTVQGHGDVPQTLRGRLGS